MSGLLVAGTTSDAGKSLVVTGLCRALARRGVLVAPYKAQNMSNNSMVVDGPDGLGAEIGRAQWTQALAARAEPEVAMNPVLLKPGGDRRSHVVVMGRPGGAVSSEDWERGRRHLAEAAHAAYADLASRHEVVVAEGAGSPAEVNLRAGDYVNMGLARAFGLPTVVVGDIDRGGVFAAYVGTRELLDPEDRALLAGWVVNKFRGDVGLLRPGLVELERRTSLPVHGVLPWRPDVWLDSEDALDLEGRTSSGAGARVAVVRFPRISNFTDVDALGLEPGLDRAVLDHAARGRAVLGICGGCQVLGRTVSDPDGVEGDRGAVAEGLGLLDLETVFGTEKVLRRHDPAGYEIHHGRVTGALEAGSVTGTMVHGALEDDTVRASYLATALGVRSQASFPAARERRLDLLGDLVEEHLDVDALLALAARP